MLCSRSCSDVRHKKREALERVAASAKRHGSAGQATPGSSGA
jgi:hypothetical protein